MFLTALNKQEAIAFINLISEFALSDHKLRLEEKVLIEDACEEMGVLDSELVDMQAEEAIEVLEKATERKKKIIYFEFVRLGLVDDNYDIHEVEFLENVADKLKISRAVRFAFAGFFFKYSDTDRLDKEDARGAALAIIGHDN